MFIDKTALTLTIIGSLNWLLVGLFSFDLVAAIFGAGSVVARIIYIIIGICALWSISLLFRRTHPVED